ncbi:protein-glutamate O-methyltransferase [bacterium]|nr:protein-glutamate O-methyltransferase [bacterium]
MDEMENLADQISQVGEGGNMDHKTFDAFRTLVYKKSGINLGEHKQALVCARVGKRMRMLGIHEYKDYLQYVSDDDSGEELVKLLDVISTNVTHFFREPKHFEVLESILKQWQAAGQRKYRIWCAASSTGEEPYTIAMTVKEALGEGGGLDVKILATDISTRVLDVARQGMYEDRKLDKVPEAFLRKYFQKGLGRAEGYYLVKKPLRDMLSFGRLNLSIQPFPIHGPLDIIFCRNVMIYFDNHVRGKVLDNMYRLLRPGGYLMVGHAESLTGLVSSFKNMMPSVYVKGAP